MSRNLVIIGAPRSGTNMLRDLLTAAPGIATWDCDEIPLIWKHGNLDLDHDELGPERARPEIAAYLQSQFAKLGRRTGAEIVVEKTCANSLRIPFVLGAIPDAVFVVIRRDGIDATASTMQRWNAPFDWKYTAKKARFVPPGDVPRHLVGYVRRRLIQRRTGEAGTSNPRLRVSTWWGPRPHDFRQIAADHPLDEVAFIQWQRCVELSTAALADVPADRVIELGYEAFVADPAAGLRTILVRFGAEDLAATIDTSSVRASSVGKGRAHLGPDAVARLETLGGSTLRRLGYA